MQFHGSNHWYPLSYSPLPRQQLPVYHTGDWGMPKNMNFESRNRHKYLRLVNFIIFGWC